MIEPKKLGSTGCETSKDVRLSVNGNLILEVGKESISNPHIAILELIKNAYDAGATEVKLSMEKIGNTDAYIEIADNGEGMNYETIIDKFLDVGSPHKKESNGLNHGRILVGAKGIGRFGSQCLGNKLTVYTSTKTENVVYVLEMDWSKFNSQVKLNEVPLSLKKVAKPDNVEQGTTLIISGLQHNWSDNGILKKLYYELSLLNSPNHRIIDFVITDNLVSSYKTESLTDKLLKDAPYRFSVVFEKGKLKGDVFQNGTKVHHILQDVVGKTNCGDLNFDLYFYHKSHAHWNRLSGEIDKQKFDRIKKVIDLFGGIKLYRDGFRVHPYGDENNDWLELDKWARDSTIIPGNTQVFGVVSITKSKNPEIIDVTSREGVVGNDAFIDLRSLIRNFIKLFADYRAEKEQKAKRKSRRAEKTVLDKAKLKLLTETSSESEPPSPFITGTITFPNSHYEFFINEINNAYKSNYPNSVFALSRKILENLVYHILEKKFPRRRELWFCDGKRRPPDFSELVDNLFSKRQEFVPNVCKMIEEVHPKLKDFRNDANKVIHTDYHYLEDTNELKKYKIPWIMGMLSDVYSRV